MGTCHILPCNEKHGATDCVNGECLCAEDTCSADGYTCAAQEGDAGETGDAGAADDSGDAPELSEALVQELSTDATIAQLKAKVGRLSKQLAQTQGHSNSSMVLFGVCALLSSAAAVITTFVVLRKRTTSQASEPLLAQ